jgi:hypothetical protein
MPSWTSFKEAGMNCAYCGEEIREPSGYLCQKCLDCVAAKKPKDHVEAILEEVIQMSNGLNSVSSINGIYCVLQIAELRELNENLSGLLKAICRDGVKLDG